MTPPKAFEALLAGQAPFGGRECGTALRVNFIVAGYAGQRTFLSKGCAGGANAALALLFGEDIRQFECDIAEFQGRPRA